MPIDIANEMLLSLTEATKALPPVNGRRPAIATLWRWCRKGLRGVRLDYVRVGRNIATSREALNRFVNALAASDSHLCDSEIHKCDPRPTASSRDRKRMLDDADKILDRAGI